MPAYRFAFPALSSHRTHTFLQTLGKKLALAPLFSDLSAETDVSGGSLAAERAGYSPLLRFWKPIRSLPSFVETDYGVAGKLARITVLVSTNCGNQSFGFQKRNEVRGAARCRLRALNGSGLRRGGDDGSARFAGRHLGSEAIRFFDERLDDF